MRSIITAALLFLISLNAQAQTYYVDATLGDDTYDGRSEATAWKTVSKINVSSFLPGDSILFKCGETWHERLDIPSSGTTASPIIYASNPTMCSAATGKPEINGSERVTGWTQYAGNIYVANVNPVAPRNLILNGSVDFEQSPWGFSSSTGGASLTRDTMDANGSSGSGSLKFTSGSTAGDHHLGGNTFAVEEGKTYQVSFKARADAGKTVDKVIARMAGVPWTWVCSFQQITVDDTWRLYTNNCTVDNGLAPTNEKLNAKFYIYLYPDYNSQGQVTIYVDDVSVTQTSPYAASVQQVFVDGQYVKRAHYPNKGYLPSKPDSVFLTTADYSGATTYGAVPGQNFLFGGSDLDAAGGGLNDLVDAGIHIRTVDWRIEDRTVSAWDASSRKITFVNDADPNKNNTEHTILKGWGYYLDNKLWMLDEPGEWYFENDPAKPDYQKLYLWLPDSGDPNAHAVEASVRDQSVYAYSKTDVIVDGLKLTNAVKNGVELNRPVDFTLSRLDVRNSGDSGIWLNGDGQVNTSATRRVENSSIVNSVRQGIHLQSMSNVVITNNTVIDSGTVGSPVNSLAAITAADQSDYLQITGNTVTNSGYIGVGYKKNSLIQGNIIEKTCLVLSDCGAIYTYNGGALYFNPDGTPTGNPIPVINSQVLNNIVIDVIGGTDGDPTQGTAAGIYLDGFTNGVVVTGNTVVNASNGVHANSPLNNTIGNNTLFGSRWSEIDFSIYGSNVSSTAVHDNAINNNLVFSLSTEPLYRFYTKYDSTAQFCMADNNAYSSMYTTTFFRENLWNGTVAAGNFTYPQWQQTTFRDLNSTLFDSFGIAPVRLTSYSGNNLLQNPDFNSDLTSWSCSSDVYPCLSLSSNCASGGNCLRYTAPVTSYFDFRQNNVNVQAGVDYIFEFDIRAGRENTVVSTNITWPPYTVKASEVTVGTAWKSVRFIYKASDTQSAKMLFVVKNANVGDFIELDNVRLEPVALEYNDVKDDALIIINRTDAESSFSCADSGSEPARCNEYVRFPANTAVIWPITLPAKSSAIVVWSANPMKDTDRDGVRDQDDVCPATSEGATTRINGCTFAQQREANLSLAIADTPDPALIGDTVSYTIMVTNNGPGPASGVTVSGTLPGCSLGTIPSGASVSCIRTVTATVAGTLSHSMMTSAVEHDPSTANNTASTTTSVFGSCTGSTGPKIAGKVTRSNGTAIPGVSLTLIRTSAPQCGNRVTTPNNGNYQFNKLANGTYTVTPSKSGCSGFTPGSRTVILTSGNQTNQNFTGACP